MTLYLKYRPKNLNELDSSEARDSLTRIFSSGKIPHAFLLAGPKGIGKTSAARIIAKVIDCEHLKGTDPCNNCEQCVSITKGTNLDVIEMDAASHRGIDDIRVLRDAVKLAPTKAKKKIYIIDEVHMLTTEASNALLKILEEPPEHVVFILATTNPEKLIETIRSRTTIITFRKAKTQEIVRSLKRVAKGERVSIDNEVLGLIAEASGGSFRDGIKILEQLIAEEKQLTKEAVGEFLFKNRSFDMDKFIVLLRDKKLNKLLEEVDKIDSQGVPIEFFLGSLIKKLRTALLSKVGVGTESIDGYTKGELMRLISLFQSAYAGTASVPVEQLPLEMAIIEWCGEGTKNSDEDIPEGPEKSSHTLSGGSKHSVQAGESANHTGAMDDTGFNHDFVVQQTVDDSTWKNVLALVKPINASMEALLRAARPISYNGKSLVLGVYYKFHKERIEEAKHRKILEDVVRKVLQSPTKVSCVLVDPPPKKVIEKAKIETVLTEGKDKDIVEIAKKIFS